MRDMKRQWLTNLAYVLLGMLLLVAYEHGASIAALVIYKNDFVSSLITCHLAKKHANELANIELTSSLRKELHKTSLIDLMSCDSYQRTRSKLLAGGVSEPRLKLVEVDALSREPELVTQSSEDFSSH